jgi:hypothetical protein
VKQTVTRCFIRGIEVARDSQHLVLRNTWRAATLGPFYLLAAVGLFCGIVFVVCVCPLSEGKQFDRPALSRLLAIASGLAGLLSLAAIVPGLYRHRRPLTLDRQTNRFEDGSHKVCSLEEISDVRVTSRGIDTIEYVVELIRNDGRTLNALEERFDAFSGRDDAEGLAGELKNFLAGPSQ